MNILYSASGVLTLLFTILLLSKKQKNLADYLLAGWFSLILLVMVTTYVHHNDISAWQGLFELTDASAFLHGPAVWLYTLALTREKFRLRWKEGWHLLPFLISLVYLFYPVVRTGETVSESGRHILLVAKMLVLFSYGVAVLFQLNKHEKKIADYFSYTDKIELSWLKFLIWSLIAIWGIAAVSQLLFYFGEIAIPQYGGFFTNLALSIFVLISGYFGIRQTTIFAPAPLMSKSGNDNSTARQRAKIAGKKGETGSAAVPEQLSNLEQDYQQLLIFMDREKPHLDPKLTLYKLAAQFDQPPHQLSQIINRQGGKNFFDFVNKYRVIEFKQKIREEHHRKHTLLAIALDCGFNSKAAFNRAFKKFEKMTPREFVKQVN